MMSTQVEPEDVFEKVKGRALSKVREVLIDTYAQDPEDLRSDIAQALDLDEEEALPKIDVEIRLSIGKQVISASGFTAEEKDEDTEDDE